MTDYLWNIFMYQYFWHPSIRALLNARLLTVFADFVAPLDFQGPAARWIAARREDVVRQMTEACLNQSLDALLSRELLMREDYELVVNQPTRTAKVRKLLDTCERHSEEFCRVVVRKLQDNKQMGLQPYPDFSTTSPPPPYTPQTAPFISNSFNTTRNLWPSPYSPSLLLTWSSVSPPFC